MINVYRKILSDYDYEFSPLEQKRILENVAKAIGGNNNFSYQDYENYFYDSDKVFEFIKDAYDKNTMPTKTFEGFLEWADNLSKSIARYASGVYKDDIKEAIDEKIGLD